MMLCFGFFVSSFCVSFFSLSFGFCRRQKFLSGVEGKRDLLVPFQTKRSRLFLVFCGGNVSFIPYKLDILSLHEHHHHVCTHYPICWRPSRLQDECAEEIGQQSRFGEF
jgi:hypothetical protein